MKPARVCPASSSTDATARPAAYSSGRTLGRSSGVRPLTITTGTPRGAAGTSTMRAAMSPTITPSTRRSIISPKAAANCEASSPISAMNTVCPNSLAARSVPRTIAEVKRVIVT